MNSGPDELTGATTKTEQGTEMITEAITAGVPFGWAAGDEVYGRSPEFRAACEDAGEGYVPAVTVSFQVTTPGGRKAAVAAMAGLVPPGAGRPAHADGAARATETTSGR